MSTLIYDKLVNHDAKLAVIGLGYVGLPIALEFARKIKVVGFDINPKQRLIRIDCHWFDD
jgi:UDP-N-acetyl-D-galactosamine dehydrogenase